MGSDERWQGSRGQASPPGLHVLLTEADPAAAKVLTDGLYQAGHRTTLTTTNEETLARVEAEVFDVVIADVALGGFRILARLREVSPDTTVVLQSAAGSIDEAVRAMRGRAAHYVPKPVDVDELTPALGEAYEMRRVRDALAAAGLGEEPRVVGQTPAILRMKRSIPVIAESNASVLISGEPGSGKERIALAIHERSSRAAMPFVAMSCAAFPDLNLERELFGADPGSALDALRPREGSYRSAHRGTLFLDDIDDMSLTAQARLLRVLEDGRRDAPLPQGERLDVRIIAATTCDLQERVDQGRFRADLYYKLKVFQLRVPPLRERIADLPLLVQHFYERAGGHAEERFPASPRVWAALDQYAYPGNVRELQHAVEHAIVLARGGAIDLEHLPEELRGDPRPRLEPSTPSLPDAVREFEREYLQRTLLRASGQRQRAAEMLGISRKTLWVKLKQYGITDDGDEER